MADELDLEEMIRRLDQIGPPDWVREMREHFHRTGFYRPEDLRRLLGDATEPVELRQEEPHVIPGSRIEQK